MGLVWHRSRRGPHQTTSPSALVATPWSRGICAREIKMSGVVGKEHPLKDPMLVASLELTIAHSHPMSRESLALGCGE
jgi:hypothetical protein